MVLNGKINAPERVGDGSLYLNSRIKERKITVTFRLLCNTIERYNEVLAKLNQLTYAANVEVKFADEQGYHHIGTIESISLDKPLFSTTGKSRSFVLTRINTVCQKRLKLLEHQQVF